MSTAGFYRESRNGVKYFYPISEAGPRKRNINMNRHERRIFGISARQQRIFKRWFKIFSEQRQKEEMAIVIPE